jgi:hypothetical protein
MTCRGSQGTVGTANRYGYCARKDVGQLQLILAIPCAAVIREQRHFMFGIQVTQQVE